MAAAVRFRFTPRTLRDRPGAGNPLPDDPSILIVLMGSLGDVVRALPIARILKAERPRARVSWVVDAQWRDLLAVHADIDRLIVFPRVRTPRALSRFLRDLRAERYDVTLDLQRILKSGVCSLASGAGRRIGFDRPNAKEGNALFSNEYIAHHAATIPKLRHYLAFVERLGLPVPGSLDFGLSALTDPRQLPAAVRDRAGHIVTLVMGSSWPTKDWSVEGYRDLAAIITRETRLHLALVGSASHRSAADGVVDAAPADRVIDLVGRTSLLELGATLAAARAVVGPDSGPGHLAAAVGTPYVTLFGPTSVERVVPYRCQHLAVRGPVECLGCPRHRCRRREGRCMDTITASSVWSTLEPLLA